MALRATHPCFCAYNRTMDLRTPRNLKLTAFFRRSFAFRTVRDRFPIILTKTIDGLSQNKEEIAKEFGAEAKEDIKAVIGKLSRLKYEIQTNKSLRTVKSNAPDAAIYNECIKERDGQEGVPTPFHTTWLLVECYMYRKIRESLETTKYLKEFDPFKYSKQELLQNSLVEVKEAVEHLHKILESPVADKDEFCNLLEIDLWSNKCDLSLNPNGVKPVLANQISELAKNIIVNDSEKVWNALQKAEGDTIDIVLDNAGFELISDLCLAHYLTSKGLAKKVNFHVKSIPWFISDVMAKDLKWALEKLTNQQDNVLKSFGEIWTKKFQSGAWEIKLNDFWTLPVDFEMMHKYGRELYRDLSRSKMIFLKGDLNYRKLFRDTFWCPEMPVADAQGYFGPSKICAIRTCKAEIICGLAPGVADKCEQEDPLWMETGNYGVLQFSDKIVPLISENDIVKLTYMNITSSKSETLSHEIKE